MITDMRMNEDLRKLGDGHNAADPAFASLRANLLAQYNVDSVEALPVNFRGVVASNSETELTATLNKYAEARMTRELQQSKRLDSFGVLSPYVAISAASRALSGTDLRTHHRFLREAEKLRYDFVQGLNAAHIAKLSYEDDMNRNKSEEGRRKARISQDNWRVLNEFQFQPAPPRERVSQALASILSLLVWLFGIVFMGLFAARRLKL